MLTGSKILAGPAGGKAIWILKIIWVISLSLIDNVFTYTRHAIGFEEIIIFSDPCVSEFGKRRFLGRCVQGANAFP